MKYRLMSELLSCVVLAISLVLVRGSALAQDKQLTEVAWTRNGTYEWQRPDGVRYILVRACGGGGAIDARDADGSTCAGGDGAGFLWADGTSSVGGQGGDGSLTLLSLTHAANT